MYASRVKGRQILLENPARESKAMKELEGKRMRKKRDKEKKKLGIIGKREAKGKGIWKFDEAQAKFDLFLPLHHLWMGYMSELLGLSHEPSCANNSAMVKAMPSSTSMHPKLLKADFHGSIMTVRRSKNPCLLGLSGIVIHETENAFKVVTKHDKLKVIPKYNSVFVFAVPLYSTLPPTHTVEMPLPLAPPFPTGPSTGTEIETVASLRKTVLDSPHIEFELYGNQFRFRSSDRAGRKFKHKETIEL
ncbi:hypothetical protein BYT27DRAFT_7227965 [Phlegmacium glaucopus]|nr:hypothetical protein BYT27DRAFT_7227965 [Phlegmacium glaucopus]